jgi:hypothetical protein
MTKTATTPNSAITSGSGNQRSLPGRERQAEAGESPVQLTISHLPTWPS